MSARELLSLSEHAWAPFESRASADFPILCNTRAEILAAHGSSLSLDETRAAQYNGHTHRMLCEQIDELAKADVRYVRSSVAQYLPPTENSFGRYPEYIWDGKASRRLRSKSSSHVSVKTIEVRKREHDDSTEDEPDWTHIVTQKREEPSPPAPVSTTRSVFDDVGK
ncbi:MULTISPECIES: hypothetical protein [Bradyrhizobium]|uniref:hypothetical protein n=1 Tax=Bradyrhizobium TaxID=374 RepID=UPI00048712C4|nr:MULTISPECIES: hypothetical protein [Bradyrhizobium]UFW51213.1 hypothetical protein BaraCB756_09415 [Bradyrhizobium arachidis]